MICVYKLVLLLLLARETYGGGSISSDQDVSIDINPITPYLGDKDVVIRCETSGATIKEAAFLSVNLETKFSSNTPLVTLVREDGSTKIEWGRHFEDAFEVSERMNVTGRLGKPGEDFVELTIGDIQCSDEGKYQCLYEGKDAQGNVVEFTKKGELIVYSYHGMPEISVDGNPHPLDDYKPIELKPGDEVDLECEGIVGKPPVPMNWVVRDMKKDQDYRKLNEEEGFVGKVFREIPEDDLCRFRSKLPLKFRMPDIPNDVVTLNCQTGFASTFVVFRNPASFGQPLVPAHKRLRLKGDWMKLGRNEVPLKVSYQSFNLDRSAVSATTWKNDPIIVLDDTNDVAIIGPRVVFILAASLVIRMVHVTL